MDQHSPVVAAVTGDSVGYAIGVRLGAALHTAKSLLFNLATSSGRGLSAATPQDDRHRPIRADHPDLPLVAGVGEMEYPCFFYNVAGGVGG